MGIATSDNSKSVRSTKTIFEHKKDVGEAMEKSKKNEFSKFSFAK